MGYAIDFKKQTADMLQSVKGLKTITEINEEFNKVEEELSKVNKKIEEYNLFEQQSKHTDESFKKQVGKAKKQKKSLEERKKEISQEKEKIEKEYTKIDDFKKDLIKGKEAFEKKIQDERDIFSKNSEEIKAIYKEINSKELTKKEIQLKKAKAAALKKARLSKEGFKVLIEQKNILGSCIEEIEKFQANPKEYFGKDIASEELGTGIAKPEGNQGNLKTEVTKPKNSKGKPETGVAKPKNSKGKSETGVAKPQNAQQEAQTDPTNLQNNIKPKVNLLQNEENVEETEKLKIDFNIKSIQYDSRTKKYVYTFEDGRKKVIPKDMLLLRLQEQLRLYRSFRKSGQGRIKSIKQMLRCDPNITRELKYINSQVELNTDAGARGISNYEKYLKYINGKEDKFIKYTLAKGILKDRKLKSCVNKRRKVIKKNGIKPEGEQPQQLTRRQQLLNETHYEPEENIYISNGSVPINSTTRAKSEEIKELTH